MSDDLEARTLGRADPGNRRGAAMLSGLRKLRRLWFAEGLIWIVLGILNWTASTYVSAVSPDIVLVMLVISALAMIMNGVRTLVANRRGHW